MTLARIGLVGLLLAVGARGAAPAPPEPAPREAPPEDGASAPPGTWYVRDGCAARTSHAETEALRGRLAPAWEAKLPGPLEAEPLVWDGHVVVTARVSPTQRALVVLASANGKVLFRKTFETPEPLEPALWRRLVVVRSAPGRLDAFAIGERELTPRWRFEPGVPVRAPLVYRDEVYARAGDDLVRIAPGRPAPIWRRRLVRSDPCLRGGHLYVVEYDVDERSAYLAAVRREDGTGTRVFVGQHPGNEIPELDRSSEVFAFDEDVIVRHAMPVRTTGRETATIAWVERTRAGRLSSRGLVDLAGRPVAAGALWMAETQDTKEGRALAVVAAKEATKHRFEILASDRLHPEFARLEVPATVVPPVVYVGGRAFDATTKRILRARSLPTQHRAVPARAAVLLADGDRVVAYREERAASGGVAAAPWPAAMPRLEEGVVVFADGVVETGTFVLDPAAGTLSVEAARGTPRPPRALSEATLAVDAAGRVRHAGPPDDVARAVSWIVERELAQGWVAIAKQAAQRDDGVTLADALEQARTNGAEESELGGLARRLEALERRKPPSASVIAKSAAGRDALLARARGRLWDVVAGLPDGVSAVVRADLVRRVLDADPRHAAATAWVRSRLPPEIVPAEPFEAREWVDFVEAIAQAPIRLVPPPRPGERDLSYAQRELGSARHFWRPDVQALESRQLLILTPLRRPGQVARCLSMGELVCDALETLFREGTGRRDARYPLILRLYESQEEYLKESEGRAGGGAGLPTRTLEWTSGHYSPQEGLSRIYLPDRPDAFEAVRQTYAHELTHHWIEERCPCFGPNERRGALTTPGYWVVEGYATFVEEFRFDLRERRFDESDPLSENLDVVASTPAASLLPWRTLFLASHGDFFAVDKSARIEVPLRGSLGLYRLLSKGNLFYAQAAAACRYLHLAEDGRHRRALVELVADYYTGRTRADHLEKRTGMTPDELGQRIVRWAKDTAARAQ